MNKRGSPFVPYEWYHCYNVGIEKRTVFEDLRDYQRFLEILYLANDETPLRRNDIGSRKFEEVLRIPRGNSLVSLGAYCLMPTHFHLAVREINTGGITTFMRKVGTAYTLYFNGRYARQGNLFLKPFRSLQVPIDRYPHLISYVHASPTSQYEPEWRTGHVVDPQFVEEHLMSYPYSSLGAYADHATPRSALVDAETLSSVPVAPIQKMLREARQYLQYRAPQDIP